MTNDTKLDPDSEDSASDTSSGEHAVPEAPAEVPNPEAQADGADAAAPDDVAIGAEPPTVESLAAELEAVLASAQEDRDAMLRARAELENARRRAEREIENAHKYGLERFVAELLPVKDSLELGLSVAQTNPADVDGVAQGMALTLKMFAQAAEKFGVREVAPEGEAFDPKFHQAISTQEAADAEPGTVLTVVQKGYVLNDRLVRPAMVVVAK